MCPACISALALTIAGTGSTGGLTALVVSKIRRKKARREAPAQNQKEKP